MRVPLDSATSFSGRSVEERWYTLVRAHGEDGTVGIGFCYSGSAAGELSTMAVRDLLAPRLVGRDSHDGVGIWDDMYQQALLHGRTGSVMRALSAIDIAIWDLNARLAGLPLSKFIGSTGRSSVPAYASGGYYLDGKSAQDLGDEVRSYVDLGFEAVKIKVGRGDISLDSERIAAARDALGPGRLLMLDANNAWRDLPSALRALDAWADYDPYWIEEPFSPDDIANHARLSSATPITVATGEIEAGRWRHLEILERSAAAILQTDAAVCGGITEFLRIAHTADAFGVSMAPHWFHDLHVHLVASISNGRWVEYFPGADVLNFRRLLDSQLVVMSGGMLEVPSAPGLGFGFDATVVDRFATGPWS